MPWVKLDDQFPDHPKVLRAGEDAAWLYVAGLCYCQAKLTDGMIPDAIVARLTRKRAPFALAERLVTCELWCKVEGGFMVHDYAEHNDPAEKVKRKRAATKKRVKEWRERQEQQRHGNAVTTSVTDTHGNAVTNSVGNALVTSPTTANRNPLTATALKPVKEKSAAARPERLRKPRQDDLPEVSPLPYTATQALDALRVGVAVDPWPRELYPRLVGVCKSSNATLDDLALVGAWLAKGGDGYGIGYRKQPASPSAVCTGETLASWIAVSRRWQTDGRPAIVVARNSNGQPIPIVKPVYSTPESQAARREAEYREADECRARDAARKAAT